MNTKERNQLKYETFLLKPTLKNYTFQPIRVCLYLTRACNLSCPNCTYSGNEYFRKASFLSVEQFNRVKEATREYAVSYAMAGGEPLLNKHVLEFAELVRDVPGATTQSIVTDFCWTNTLTGSVKVMCPGCSLASTPWMILAINVNVTESLVILTSYAVTSGSFCGCGGRFPIPMSR